MVKYESYFWTYQGDEVKVFKGSSFARPQEFLIRLIYKFSWFPGRRKNKRLLSRRPGHEENKQQLLTLYGVYSKI